MSQNFPRLLDEVCTCDSFAFKVSFKYNEKKAWGILPIGKSRYLKSFFISRLNKNWEIFYGFSVQYNKENGP